MSSHVEWSTAKFLGFEMVDAGGFVDAHGETNNWPALLIGYDGDDVFLVEGKPDEIREALMAAIRVVDRFVDTHR